MRTHLPPLALPPGQGACKVGAHANERHASSTTEYRVEVCANGWGSVLVALCGKNGLGGDYPWPTPTAKQVTTSKKLGGVPLWTYARALKERLAPRAAVYNKFKDAVRYARNVLNPLLLACCPKFPELASGWTKEDAAIVVAYNLKQKSKAIPVDLEPNEEAEENEFEGCLEQESRQRR